VSLKTGTIHQAQIWVYRYVFVVVLLFKFFECRLLSSVARPDDTLKSNYVIVEINGEVQLQAKALDLTTGIVQFADSSTTQREVWLLHFV
jgi:hypothetical protein